MVPIPKNILLTAGATTTAVAAGVAGYLAMSRPAPAPLSPAPLMASAQPSPSADPPAAAPVAASVPPIAPPTFDVVRVEPTGETVVAGRAEPNVVVALLSDGAKIAEATSDASGAFVILPPPLPSGDHMLSLSEAGPQAPVSSAQTVAASVPKVANAPTLVAIAAPNEPTRVLSGAPKPAPGAMAIVSAEVDQGGVFFATGSAPPGANVRLYLNNALAGEAPAGADGAWSIRLNRALAPGHYDLRADAMEAAGDKVVVRAEAPFDVAARFAAKAQPASIGKVVLPDGRSLTVSRGDSLWRISRRVLGQGIRYTQIYEANAGQIRDPNKIWPGQVFVAP